MNHISVLHILGGVSNAGAGRGTYWLHRALKTAGVDSRLLIQHSLVKDDPKVIRGYTNERGKRHIKWLTERDQELLLPYPGRDPFIFSPGMFGIDITKCNAFQKADIIHLHWINNGFLSIRHISEIKKPIVWTFRDPWPMTGGCHVPYRFDCEGYRNHCGYCPQLDSKDEFDLSWQVMEEKSRSFGSNIHPVAMSPWMYNSIRESSLFRNHSIELIPNNIDTEIFRPFDRQKSRELLSLPSGKKIIAFGAIHLDDKHKGLALFLEALRMFEDKSNLFCVFFGNDKSNILKDCPVDEEHFGYIQDNDQLMHILSAADLFVAPVKHDNFPKTVGEAMACGLPVVNIKSKEGNLVMHHKENCYLTESGTPAEIREGIQWTLSLDGPHYEKISSNARATMVSECSFEAVSNKYIDLYRRILRY